LTREISRQTFLRGAAGALAAGAFIGSARASGEPVASSWDGLSRSISGQVIQPNAPQFDSAKAVFNTNYNGLTPAAVVTATSVADVQKAMAFASANNLKVAPRGGGHSYVGASTANGTMVLDLRQLPGGIDYDAATGQVTVTPATSLYAMHQVLAAAGRGIPTGTCPSVGAAGHALGGGLGAHSRHAGLMSDALRSATVVLPGGQTVTASANSQPDLFWALRGGGGGNFGATTSLTFATFPIGDVDVVNLNFPPQSFGQVLVGWQSWLRTADRSCWALADATVDQMGTHCRILATCPARWHPDDALWYDRFPREKSGAPTTGASRCWQDGGRRRAFCSTFRPPPSFPRRRSLRAWSSSFRGRARRRARLGCCRRSRKPRSASAARCCASR